MTRAPENGETDGSKGNDVNDNIRERKKAEDALRESEEKYRSVFAAESDAIFLIDRDTFSILDVNEAACRLYGFSREELLRLKGTDVSAEPGLSEESIRDVTLVSLRHHKKKDGTVFPVEIAVSPLSIKGRNLILGTVRDITERNATETVLRRTRV